MLITEVNSDFK